jgi:hypothetical protein
VKASSNLPDQTETGAIEKRAIKLEVLGRMLIIGGVITKQRVYDDTADSQDLECAIVIWRL